MNLWERYVKTVNRNCLKPAAKDPGFSYWHNQLFVSIIIYILPLGLVAAVPGIIMSVKSGIYPLAIIDLTGLLIVVFIAFNKRVNISFRKGAFLGLMYMISTALLYYLGSFGPGLLYLLATTFFTVLISPGIAKYWTVALNALICILFTILIYYNVIDSQVIPEYSVSSWLTVSSNLVILSAVIAQLLPMLFARLQLSNERYESIANATSDTIWDWNIATGKISYNSGMYDVFGHMGSAVDNIDNWIGKIHKEDREAVEEKVAMVLKNGIINFQMEYRFLCADKTYKHILARSVVLSDNDNNPKRVIGVMQDISDLKTYINKIKGQNEKLLEIAWTQSHIVRAPLARILGLVALLNDDPANLHCDQKELINYITEASKELDVVIGEIVRKTEEVV